MIYVYNYSQLHYCIEIDEKQYNVIPKNDMPEGETIKGVGGSGEDGNLYSLYVKDGKVYFQIENEAWEIITDDFSCTNEYINSGVRQFMLISKQEMVCSVTYKPYIDPGMIYYDAEEDEFDVLLYISKLLKSEESIENFRKARSN